VITTAAKFGATIPSINATAEIKEFFKIVEVRFQAFHSNGTQRSNGGDDFLVTFYGYSYLLNSTFKMAVDSDYVGGSYLATLVIPSKGIDRFNLTLTLHYSCHQGYAPMWCIHQKLCPYQIFAYCKVDPRPIPATPHENTSRQILSPKEKVADLYTSLPFCDVSQQGLDCFGYGYLETTWYIGGSGICHQ
jgi:hypothetical protein